jgi:hypothetical protein
MTITRNGIRRSALAVVGGVMLVLLCGCRTVVNSGVVVEHHPGDGILTLQVPYTATYALYALNSGGADTVFLERANIERRSHVGFVWQPDGSFVAYAGGRKFPLPPEGHYVWRITPESERTNRELARAEVGKVMGTAGTVLIKVSAFAVVTAVTIVAGGHQ